VLGDRGADVCQLNYRAGNDGAASVGDDALNPPSIPYVMTGVIISAESTNVVKDHTSPGVRPAMTSLVVCRHQQRGQSMVNPIERSIQRQEYILINVNCQSFDDIFLTTRRHDDTDDTMTRTTRDDTEYGRE
jgi:hypothetical protein